MTPSNTDLLACNQRPGETPDSLATALRSRMDTPLRVLLLEDSEDDAVLMLRELRRSGFHLTWERHETAAAMVDALRHRHWDVILCDYHMPGFSALAALHLLAESGADVPLIVVSGEQFEEIGVRVFAAGARNYISKEHLELLSAAVSRELGRSAQLY